LGKAFFEGRYAALPSNYTLTAFMKARWNNTPQAPEFPEPVHLVKRIPALLRAAVLNPIDSGCAGSSGATDRS
jgi:hypothetical protein